MLKCARALKFLRLKEIKRILFLLTADLKIFPTVSCSKDFNASTTKIFFFSSISHVFLPKTLSKAADNYVEIIINYLKRTKSATVFVTEGRNSWSTK